MTRTSLHSLFWKVFIIIWMASITEVMIASAMVNLDVKRRVDQFEVSERFTRLADFIITRYESGLDVKTPEPESGEESEGTLEPNAQVIGAQEESEPRGGTAPGRMIMVIDDLWTGEKIFGTRFPEDKEKWVQWEMKTPSGGNYLVSVLDPTVSRLDLWSFFTPFRLTITALVTALFSWWFTLLLTRPLNSLRTHVDELGSGHLDQTMESDLINRRDELGDLARAVDSMATRIQTLLESRQRLLYDVSHELRAPLARLQVAAEIARDKAASTGVSPAVFERLQQEGELLNQLITELLNLAKNETDHGKTELVRLDELIYRQIEDVRFGHPERTITAQLNEAKEMISIRPLLMDRALHNLMENAVKYSPADKPIHVSVHKLPKQWQIVVEDCGPGIPEESLETVFRPFNRLNPESAKGFGLGLSITRRSIASLGGTIKLSNRPEGGLRAEILLPR